MATSTIKQIATSLVKSINITGTTDVAGNIALSGINMSSFVISAVSSRGYVVGIATSGGLYYAKVVGNDNPLAPLINTDITVYVKYI